MNATSNVKLKEKFEHPGMPSCRIDVNDFAHLFVAINRWDKFLDSVFLVPINGSLTEDVLEEISLEDSQYYLDLQIQLSHCLIAAQDPDLSTKFEGICRQIKQDTYSLIATTLRNLADNKRGLLELGNKDEHVLPQSSGPVTQWMDSPDLEVSVEYKDCLLQQRKQLKSDMIGQKSLIKSQILRLKKELRMEFYSNPQ